LFAQAYGCLRFGAKGDSLAPIVPESFAEDEPTLAAEIVIFDCWIANEDRHERNLAYVRGHTAPMIFDHDQSLFGANGGRRLDRLANVRDDVILNGCLAPYITSCDAFTSFSGRIGMVCASRNAMMRPIFEEARRAKAISEDEEIQLIEFLEHRASRLLEMFKKLPNLKGQMVLT